MITASRFWRILEADLGAIFVRDMFDFVLSARARARALPTVGSPAPVRRGLWSLPSSCPSSRTTGRFSRARRAMGAPWARYERTMCACISGVTFKITSPFFEN